MKQNVEEEKNAIAEIIAAIFGTDNTDIQDLPLNQRESLHEKLQSTITVIGTYMEDIRNLRVKEQYGIEKLLKQAGDDL